MKRLSRWGYVKEKSERMRRVGGDRVGKSAIILAAGLGTRMNSKHHKVLHEICGKPMIVHILDELDKLALDQVIVVVGQQREAVQAMVRGRADIAVQTEQLGTGHAVQSAVPHLKSDTDTTVVLYGDAPLIRAETIANLLETCQLQQASAVMLTATVAQPTGLGRVFLDEDGLVEQVVEEKDATPQQRQTNLINTGIYAYQTKDLRHALTELKPNNAQAEYYLTDTLSILRNQQKRVLSMAVDDPDEIASVNDRVQLARVEALYQNRIRTHWMRAGVTLIDPATTYISAAAIIGRDTTIRPGTVIEGLTVVGEDCTIGPNARLVDAEVAASVTIHYSVVLSSFVDESATVGPFAYIRPGSTVGKRVKVGDFVELKNTQVGDDSKISHLAYVGDATVGQRVNVGCGVITVNYDGAQKHQTIVGDDSFVGSNVNLIAPITVGQGAYICAGSTITGDVPADGFAIARSEQVTKEDYVQAWKSKKTGYATGGETTHGDGR